MNKKGIWIARKFDTQMHAIHAILCTNIHVCILWWLPPKYTKKSGKKGCKWDVGVVFFLNAWCSGNPCLVRFNYANEAHLSRMAFSLIFFIFWCWLFAFVHACMHSMHAWMQKLLAFLRVFFCLFVLTLGWAYTRNDFIKWICVRLFCMKPQNWLVVCRTFFLYFNFLHFFFLFSGLTLFREIFYFIFLSDFFVLARDGFDVEDSTDSKSENFPRMLHCTTTKFKICTHESKQSRAQHIQQNNYNNDYVLMIICWFYACITSGFGIQQHSIE